MCCSTAAGVRLVSSGFFQTILFLLTIVVATLFFLNGFLPLKKPIPGYATDDDFPSDPSGARIDAIPEFDRLVIMLVDALRRDFVFGEENVGSQAMPFVQQLMAQGSALKIGAAAHPPTVTMPRLKAITSGDIPGFIDVVMNLNSRALLADNLITQLERAGKRLVFYGDETWLALFPDHFSRYEGTTSFFVSDYTEVDNNVTRLMEKELARDDWDVMILHYLGLDHIGHLEGPSSRLVPPKLHEMDTIFSMIHKAVSEQDRARGTATLILLCGDHGMSEAGSHGGASAAEVQTPFVLTASTFEAMPPAVLERYQIDIVPTLATLLSVPIPRNSLGVLITEALHGLSARRKLSAAYRNLQQLVAVLRANSADGNDSRTNALLVEAGHAVDAHRTWLTEGAGDALASRVLAKYQASAAKLQALCASALVRHDLTAMVYASALFWLMLVAITSGHATGCRPTTFSSGVLGAVGCMAGGTVLQLACTSSAWSNSAVCEGGVVAKICYAALLGATGSYAVSGLCLWLAGKRYRASELLREKNNRPWLEMALVAGTAVRSLSYLSSSFVEEEQQTWYYLSATALLLLFFASVTDGRPWTDADVRVASYLQPVCSGPAAAAAAAPLGDNKSTGPPRWLTTSTWRLLAALALSRLIRSWNCTGDKWAHLPDVADWLHGPDNIAALLLSVMFSLVGLGWWALNEAGFWRSAAFLIGLVIVQLNTIAEGVHTSAQGLLHLSSHWKVILTRAGFALAALCAVLPSLWRLISKTSARFCQRKSRVSAARHCLLSATGFCDVLVELRLAWLLLVLLLHKGHNVPLVLVLVVQESLVARCLISDKPSGSKDCDIVRRTLLYAWLSQAGYFAQGNSNSIATLDVGAGYKGSLDYNPMLVGCLMASITFASQVFWLASLLLRLLAHELSAIASVGGDAVDELCLRRFGVSLRIVARLYLVERCFTMGIYTALITAERYHLFIWSVFTPKLLYEAVFTMLSAVLSAALFAASYFITRAGCSQVMSPGSAGQ